MWCSQLTDSNADKGHRRQKRHEQKEKSTKKKVMKMWIETEGYQRREYGEENGGRSNDKDCNNIIDGFINYWANFIIYFYFILL